MATAKVFKHGNSQAVRLPKEFRVQGTEVEIFRVGQVILLRPKRFTLADINAAFSGFAGGVQRDLDDDQDRDFRGKRT